MTNLIQYPYAYDEVDDLVFIGDVKKENRYDHVYHCPNCGGEMIPRLGEYNSHCFAHATNKKCGGESYIHKTAKVLLARRFNERTIPFRIGLTSKRVCVKAGACLEHCHNGYLLPKYQEYNLLDSYDLPAEVEVDVLEPDGITHFTPDVKLQSSNPKRDDIFIEVFYKHKVTKDKVASGHKIIEIRVRELDDLRGLETQELFKESKDIIFYNFKDKTVTPEQIEAAIRQWIKENDFPESDEALPPCKQSRQTRRRLYHLQRYVLYKSGKAYCNGIYEDELQTHNPSALMDFTFESGLNVSSFSRQCILAKKDNRARFCDVCEHCIKYGSAMWCNLGKNGTTRKGTFNRNKGCFCTFFEWESISLMAYPIDEFVEGKDYTIWINPSA